MGRILSLLKAAASEKSLHSKMGQWRLAVSAKLDSLTGGGGGAALLEFFNQGLSLGNFGRVNFTGAGVTASVVGNVVDVSISGGAAAAECGVNAYSTQAAWFVSQSGSDTNDGATVLTPLATSTELACRLNDKVISQNTTITYDGVIPDDMHVRLAPAPGVTVTIVGTPSLSATRTVSAFTPYNETAHTAALLDTTPGVLNTFANQRVRDSATGAVGWLLAFPSATTATTSYFTDSGGFDVQLNPGDTEFIEDVTATQIGWLHIENVGEGDIVIRDLAVVPQFDKPMSANGGTSADDFSIGRVTFFGVVFPTIVGQPRFQDSNCDFYGCMFQGGATTFSTGLYRMSGMTFQGCTPVLQAGTWVDMQRTVNRACGFQMTGGAQVNAVNHGFIVVGSSGGVDIGDMAFYRFSGRMWQTAAFAAPVPFGIDVHNGGGVYYGANKPELTGSVNDTSIGGTPKAYAAIPFTDALNLSRIVASTT